MRSSNRARHLHRTGAAAVTALALAGVTLVPAPAQATGIVGAFGASTSFSSAGGTCSEVSGTDTSDSFSSDGKTVSKTASGGGTVVDSGDATDTAAVAASAKATFRATESGGSLATLSFAAVLSASVIAEQGAASSCAARAGAGAGAEALITVVDGGWLTVTVDKPAGTEASFQLIGSMSSSGVIVSAEDDELATTSTVWLDGGQYMMGVSGNADTGLPGSGSPSSLAGTVKVSASFLDGGTAAAKAAGKGAKYVSFPGSRNCNDKTVAVTFTGKAKGLAKATFYVNGKKKAAIADPPAKVSVILPKLVNDQAVTVKAVLVPDKKSKKGKKKPKPVTVSRSYLACS